MPLYWRIRQVSESPHISIPARAGFAFTLDEELGLLRQSASPELMSILRTVYEAEHNVGYLQDGHMFAAGYGDDLLAFIDRSIRGRGARTAMEIGCGGCYILEKLAGSGLEVMGVDPSPVAASKGVEKGIRVVQDFFPSNRATGLFDLVLHADVLEHVDDPVGFLRLQRNQLNEGGIAIISTPDCSRSIELGDVSMALHQHLNYFDRESLATTVASAGLRVLNIERAKFGGSLYCAAVRQDSPSASAEHKRAAGKAFMRRATGQLDRFRRQVNALVERGRTIGFYMPLRAVPYLAHLDRMDNFRFFDDTPHWHGRCLDGVDLPIENFGDLEKKPVDELFVMSLTFSQGVVEKVSKLRSGATVTSLPEFLAVDDVRSTA